MNHNIVSERACSAELRDLPRRVPARSVGGAVGRQAKATSSAGLLLLLLGVWAARGVTLVSLSSWLR